MTGIRVDTDRLFQEISEQEIPVGTTYWTWWLILPAIGTTLSLVLAALVQSQTGRMACLVVAGVLTPMTLASFFWITAGRKWLTILSNGFVLRTASGRLEFQDEQVIALGDFREPRYASGRLLGEFRIVELRLESNTPGEPRHLVRLRRYLGVDELDLLDLLVERLKGPLFQKAVTEIQRQRSLKGTGWHWRGNELQLNWNGTSATIDPAQISKLRHEDGHLVFWLRWETHPSIRFPVDGESGWLLEECLRHELEKRGPADVLMIDEVPSPLGRILTERRPSLLVAYSMFALGAFALFVALVCLTLGILHRSLIPSVLGISLGFPAVMILALGRRMLSAVFRFGEQGIEKIGIGGHQRMLLEEVDVLLFEATRQRSYGRYVGTLYSITLASKTDPQKSIYYTETTRQEDRRLLELRERVAALIARQMAQELALTGFVRWTPELLLTTSAIEFRPQRVYGWRRQPAEVAFDDMVDFDVEEPWLHVWSNAEERAVIKASTSAPNFYPGLVLLEQIIEKTGHLRSSAHANGQNVT